MKSDAPTVDAVQVKTKVGRGTVQRIKEGQTSVGTDKLLAIAEAFEVELWELLQPGMKPQNSKTAPSAVGAPQTPAAALECLGQVIAEADELTRGQIKPILDQLFKTPEQAAVLAARLQATLALAQSQVGSAPEFGAHQQHKRAA